MILKIIIRPRTRFFINKSKELLNTTWNQCWAATQFEGLEPQVPIPVSKDQTRIGF
jgi:hypothetical protein